MIKPQDRIEELVMGFYYLSTPDKEKIIKEYRKSLDSCSFLMVIAISLDTLGKAWFANMKKFKEVSK